MRPLRAEPELTTHGSSTPRLFPQIEPGSDAPEYLEDILANRFTLAGETHELGTPIHWLSNPSRDIEWHILLHKFYYAVGLASRYSDTRDQRLLERFIGLVDSWIAQTPVDFIAADVTGRRIQNWIYAWFMFESAEARFPPEFMVRMLDSIEAQTQAMIVDMAPARNHRTLELYTVFLVAVAFPAIRRSSEWLEFSVRELTANVETDLLADGVHCELSTDYHHIVLRNYLLWIRVARANAIDLPEHIGARIRRALDFAMYVHRPDGTIPALSDSDSRSYEYLLGWGAELFSRSDYRFVATRGRAGTCPRATNVAFPDGGYFIQRSAWRRHEFADARYLVFDCGPIGAGNHGHLDALSIEAYAHGQRLIVDPGRYTYDESDDPNWRARFRGTGAHNTILVNDRDQAIYEQRGARKRIERPHPRVTAIDEPQHRHIAILHGRIESPNYAAIHERYVLFVRQRYWVVVDQMIATDLHDYELGFQLDRVADHNVRLEHRADVALVSSPGLQMVVLDPGSATRIVPGRISEEYGVAHAAPRVVQRRRAADALFVTLIAPYRSTPNTHTIATEASGHVLTLAHGLWIDRWHIGRECIEWRGGKHEAPFALPLVLRNV